MLNYPRRDNVTYSNKFSKAFFYQLLSHISSADILVKTKEGRNVIFVFFFFLALVLLPRLKYIQKENEMKPCTYKYTSRTVLEIKVSLSISVTPCRVYKQIMRFYFLSLSLSLSNYFNCMYHASDTVLHMYMLHLVLFTYSLTVFYLTRAIKRKFE